MDLSIVLPDDFKKNSNTSILLTGAGFSKDLGAPLANEIATQIFNMTNISQNIRKLIQDNDCDYEAAFDNATTHEDSKYLETAILNIFKNIDKTIFSKISDDNHLKLLKLFQSENKYNFILTLNQDLVIERYYILKSAQNPNNKPHSDKETITKCFGLNFPFTNYCMADVIGSKWGGNYCIQYPKDYNFENFIQVIKYQDDNKPILSQTNYIKLHGSANWCHSEGKEVLISGTKKTGKISSFNALQANFLLFEKLCEIQKLRIVIVGYGFKDNHVNKHILRAIDNGAQLAIIDSKTQTNYYNNAQKFSKEKLKNSNTMYIPKNIVGLKDEDFKNLSNWLTQKIP